MYSDTVRGWRRALGGVVAAALVATACSSTTEGAGPVVAEGSADSSNAPTTTQPVPTSSSTSSSSTTLPEPIDIADFIPPTTALNSFTFESSMLEIESDPYGIVSSGVFVKPDAVSCETGNPGLIGGSLGVGTAIGDVFWFDDGLFGADEEDRDSEFAKEWLTSCPGAPEYWERPFFLDDRFVISAGSPGEDIDGVATMVYEVSSATNDLVVEYGKVWLTEDGWPIRVTIMGSALGGVFPLIYDEADPDDPDLMIDFEVDMAIVDTNRSQIVRAPDGSDVVGPLAEVTSTVPTTVPPSGSLAATLDSASRSGCGTYDTLEDVLGSVDLDLLQLSRVSVSYEEDLFEQVYPGMAGGGSPTYQVVTTADEMEAMRQADLLFNHRAPLAAWTDWTGFLPPEAALDGRLHISLASKAEDGEIEDIVSWDGLAMTYADGFVEDVIYHAYLSFPTPELALSPSDESDARSRLDEWTAAVSEVAPTLAEGDLQAVENLRALYGDLADTRAVACALLGTAYVAADEAISANAPRIQLYGDEIAVQHTLLAIEYVNLLGGYLDQPSVDWLQAEGIDLDRGFFSGDTTGVTLAFFAGLLSEALSYSDPGVYR